MKKWLLTITLVFSVCFITACSSTPEPSNTTVENGAFIYEPQTLIDQINTTIENADDGEEYFTCDDFEASGESIHTSDKWSRIILSFETNDNGFITRCRLYWQISGLDTNVLSSAGLYSGILVDKLSPNNADEITESMTSIIVAGEGEADFNSDGIAVNFQSFDGKNWLDISIVDENNA